MHSCTKTTAATAMWRMMALLPALALAACTTSYPHMLLPEGDIIGNEENYDLTPLMVYVNEPEFFAVSSTRGTGDFDTESGNMEKFANARFHVYAFRDGYDLSGLLTSPADMRRYSYANTNVPSGVSPDTDFQDCLLDGFDYRHGMPMALSRDGSGFLSGELGIASGEEQPMLYYSHLYQYVGYNFFAYYIDDCEMRNFSRSSNRISFDLSIDGCQDVLCGMAPKLTAEVLNDKISSSGSGSNRLTLSTTERNTILNIGNYSTYAAHRGVHPVINLDHQLTQLKFCAYPGSASCDGIEITGIEVCSRHTGTMTVASSDVSQIGVAWNENDSTWIALREPSVDGQPCAELEDGKYVMEWSDSYAAIESATSRPGLNIGGSLMLPSWTGYDLIVHYTCPVVEVQGGPTVMREMQTRYRLVPQSTLSNRDENGRYVFRKGYSYTVNIVVYGLENIQIGLSITPWTEGGDLTVDFEDEGQTVVVTD